MSSKYVRDQVLSLLGTTSENVIDFAAEYRTVEDILSAYGLTDDDSWIGIEFLPSNEAPYGVTSNNSGGCYRENGAFMMHVVEPISATHRDNILTRADALLQIFRGATINGDIIIGQVGTVNFDSNLTLNFESGYEGGAVTVDYYRNFSI